MGELANKPTTAVPGRGMAAIAANHYSNDLRAYLARRLGNPEDVEDVAQSVFLKLVRITNDELVVEKPFGFVRMIANRVLAELGASRAQDRAHMVRSGQIERLVDTFIATNNAEDPGEDLDLDRQLEAAFAQLSPTLAAVIILVARDGLSYAEAAARLEISEHAVKKNLQRARAQLRRSLFAERVG